LITFEKISDVHFKAYKHDVFLSSIEVHKDKYVILNRNSKTVVPKRLKNYLKFMILETYKQDIRALEIAEYANEQLEGSLSIKKMLKKLL